MKPLVPCFATMHSVISAWARCGEVNIKAPQHRGNKASLLSFDHTLAAHARKLSARVLGGAISAEDIIDRHSHVPMYASFMTALERFGWREHLLNGGPGRDVKAVGLRRNGMVESETLRKCPTCVREDQERYGCAHWRIYHQWPVAQHCVVHGDSLVSQCADCKSPFTRGHEASLADDPCANCGSNRADSEPKEMPDGYWPMLRMMYRALKGNAPELSPMVRTHPLLRIHPSTWGADSSGAEAQARLRAMLSEWESPSVDELGARLGSNWIWRSDPVRGRSVDASPFFVQAAVVSAELQRLAM